MKKPSKSKQVRTQPKPKPEPPPMPPARTVSVPVAGAQLGLSRNAAYLAARRGDMQTIKFHGRYRVPIAWLERVLSGDKVQP